ncbi:hypothetical protein [Catenuloplanes japonicus]|uniref:hypothetical protein n=1 Tax=Catenuloplanes japonicus TaxID=33876 RepID=UPI00052768D1|nr:hypothetical protein [Catenuloplanes japonicus]
MSHEPLPEDPFAGQSDWAPRPPRAIVPMPATGGGDLRGRRVITGLPGLGWRADLRADERVVQGSRTYVPIMQEQEWYRAEAEQIEVFAPLVPQERVWIETLGSAPSSDGPRDLLSRLVSLDAPGPRDPVAVIDSPSVMGRRVVQMVDGVERRDLRSVTDLYNNAEGDICLRVAAELDWYRWAWTGKLPKTMEVPVHLAWLE